MELTRQQHDLMYNVYLDGVIIGWWEAADSSRGWVDVFVGIDMYHACTTLEPVKYVRHRLFGIVKLEEK